MQTFPADWIPAFQQAIPPPAPPNIIIASIRQQTLGESYRMFDFAPVGGAAALAGLIFVALIGWRLIPARDSGAGGADRDRHLRWRLPHLSRTGVGVRGVWHGDA